MNLNKHSLFRYLSIDHYLRTKPLSTISKLTAFCKAQLEESGDAGILTRKTVQKDIADMKAQFDCPIEVRKGNDSYYYANSTYTFLNISPETLYNLKENIKVNFLGSADVTNLIQFDNEILDNGVAHVAIFASALLLKRMVEFDYQSISDKKAKKHCVSPQLLKQNKSGWYLLGIKDGENGIRAFNLSRITSAPKITKRKSQDKAIVPSGTTTPLLKNS